MLTILILLLAVLCAALVTGIVISRNENVPVDFSYLVVLGTMVNGSEPSIMLSERIQAAAQLLKEHPSLLCVPSGARTHNADISEAQCILRGLLRRGIAENRILPEERATTTWENIRFSLELIQKETGAAPTTIGLLTSDFHAFRVRLVARRMGIPARVIGVKSRHTIFYYPAFLREILAVWYYLLMVRR